jgi:hypothetical protein
MLKNMKAILEIKSLFIAAGILFYCETALCTDVESIKTTSGGKIIKRGEDKGKIGYATTSHRIVIEGDKTTETINCTGERVTVCPEQLYGAAGLAYNDIIDAIHFAYL